MLQAKSLQLKNEMIHRHLVGFCQGFMMTFLLLLFIVSQKFSFLAFNPSQLTSL